MPRCALFGLGSLALCKRTFKTKVIIFVSAKKEAHRMRIILGLGGLSAAELHGDLNQREVRVVAVVAGGGDSGRPGGGRFRPASG